MIIRLSTSVSRLNSRILFVYIALRATNMAGTASKEKSTQSENNIPRDFLYTMVPVNLVVGLTVIILNSLVGNFYRKGKRSTAAILYIYLTGWDITMGTTAIIHGVYMILNLELVVKSEQKTFMVMICVLYVVTNVAVRMSVFANTVLGVARTINILQPFYRIKKKFLHISFGICLFLLLALTTVDIWFACKDEYNKNEEDQDFPQFRNRLLLHPALGSSILEKLTQKRDLKRNILASNAFLLLATLIAIVCLAVQSRTLLCNPEARAMRRETVVTTTSGEEPGTSEQDKTKKSGNKSAEMRSTITVLQLTAVFCLCNTIYSIFALYMIDKPSRSSSNEEPLSMTEKLAIYITSTTVPFFNSLVNPLILITRSCDVRKFVKSKFGIQQTNIVGALRQ